MKVYKTIGAKWRSEKIVNINTKNEEDKRYMIKLATKVVGAGLVSGVIYIGYCLVWIAAGLN